MVRITHVPRSDRDVVGENFEGECGRQRPIYMLLVVRAPRQLFAMPNSGGWSGLCGHDQNHLYNRALGIPTRLCISAAQAALWGPHT